MKKIIVFIILFSFGLGFLFVSPAKALTISPAKIYLSADPGETIETEMRVGNDAEITVTYYPIFERYTVRGGETPVFTPADIGLPTWIETIPSKVTLGPKEIGKVQVLIRVPEDAEPGGHYAAIFWSSAPPERERGGVAIALRVGALVFLEVSGEVIESGEVVNFGVPKKIFNYLPISFSYGLKNTGNVHLGPEGEVTIKNIFGRTLAILEANPGRFVALPDTTRIFNTASWEPEGGVPKIEGKGFFAELKRERAGFALGYFKADLNIEYGKERKTGQASFGFWVLPWRILLIGILILAVIILFFTKGIQKYNQWIISRAKERRV